MEICFQSSTSTINFENWLNSFVAINQSLLMEIDTKEEFFVAKTFTEEKTVVKYGKISFQNAGLEVVSISDDNDKTYTLEEWNAENDRRIKVGFYKALDKFIKVVKQFSSTENHKITFKFNETVPEPNKPAEFVCVRVIFKSLSLTMAAPCAELREFTYISDKQFTEGIANIEDPIVFEHNTDVSKLLIQVSNIYSVDAQKDIIDFKVKKDDNGEWAIFAYDHNGQTYDFKLGYLDKNAMNLSDGEVPEYQDVHIPVIRQNYILGTKTDTENGKIMISGANDGTRIKICSGNNFITIIASVRV